MAGNLPPGCTQKDIDMAAPGYWDEPEDEGNEEPADPALLVGGPAPASPSGERGVGVPFSAKTRMHLYLASVECTAKRALDAVADQTEREFERATDALDCSPLGQQAVERFRGLLNDDFQQFKHMFEAAHRYLSRCLYDRMHEIDAAIDIAEGHYGD